MAGGSGPRNGRLPDFLRAHGIFLSRGAILPIKQGHRVGRRGTKNAIFSRRIAYYRRELADRLVAADMFDLDRSRDRLPDAYSLDETPVRLKEDSAGPGKILCNDSVQQAGRDTALNDQSAERRLRCEVGIIVNRIPVPRHFREHLDV